MDNYPQRALSLPFEATESEPTHALQGILDAARMPHCLSSTSRFEWSILAGVVVELHNDFNCISLATGVKALAYDSISLQGDLVHDSHAEVLARRGARTWLLARLVGEVKAPSDYTEVDGISRLFEPVSKGRWRCKAEAKLHLYCSTFPCTSQHQEEQGIAIDLFPASILRW